MTSVSIDVSAVPERPAGAGRYVVELVRRLAPREDVSLTLVSRRRDAVRWKSWGSSSSVVPVAPRRRAARLVWEQVRLGRWLRPPVEVHHAPHYTMPMRPPVPVVVTIHDLTFIDHPEWHERTKALVFGRAIRHAARGAAALLCVSATTADRLVELLRPACPVHVVPHGVDRVTFAPEEPGAGTDVATLDRLGVREPYVLHVGTLEPRKDVPSLLRAFDRLAGGQRELSLVLAGGDGWGVAAVEATLASMGHADRVVRLGYVADGTLPPLLRRAAVVAYPSLAEGFGLPALEALSCGAPLVTTSGTAMGEVAGDAALLVSPGDVGALAGAIEAALAGGPEAAGRHTWERSAEEHARIYATVAAGGPPRLR